MKVAVFDIEGDDLYERVSKVHCAWVYDVNSDTYWGYPPNRIRYLAEDLSDYDVIIGHNIIGYDTPTISKLLANVTALNYDTLVCARLLNPDTVGGHSLKKWGERLKVLKDSYGEVDDDAIDVWSEFNWEMYWYCKQDVVATVALYNYLLKQGLDPQMLKDMESNYESIQAV